MQRRGITIVEVMMVCAILVLLSGLIFAASAPARESARQQVCATHMKQIYDALALYRVDYPDGFVIPQSDVPALPGHPAHVLFGYGTSIDIERCPDAPSGYHPNSSTYEWRVLAFWPTHADDKDWWQKLNTERELKGNSYPIVLCHMHDALYYQPREREAFATHTPFDIMLLIDGSVFRGRHSGPRFPALP